MAGSTVFSTVSGGPTGCYYVCCSHKGIGFITKWELPTFPDDPQSISSSSPIWKAQRMYHIPQKATVRWQMLCRCPTIPLGRKQPGCWQTWWPPAAVAYDGPFFLFLSIPLIHQNIAAAAHVEHSWLRKQLPHCLWATRASRVIGSPLLILFQLFYWAAGSKKKAACSQKCIFPFCEIRPAPESLISLSQIRNLSYSQFTLAEN